MLSEKREISENLDEVFPFPPPYAPIVPDKKQAIEKYYKDFKKEEICNDMVIKLYDAFVVEMEIPLKEFAFLIGKNIIDDQKLVELSLSLKSCIEDTLDIRLGTDEANKYIYYFGILVIKG